MIEITSFGYKHGLPPVGFSVLDCRHLSNPHHDPDLRPLDGLDGRVQAFVTEKMAAHNLFRDALCMVASGRDKIAFGCVGGRHRSVAMAEWVAQTLRERGYDVTVTHRELVS